jgi:hypothetical protein
VHLVVADEHVARWVAVRSDTEARKIR